MNLFQFKMRSTFKTWILNFRSRLITYHSSSWLRHVQKRLLLGSTGNSEKYMVKQRLLAWIKMTFKFFLILFIYFLSILPSKHPSSTTSIYSSIILDNLSEAVKTENRATSSGPSLENKDCWCFAVLCLFVCLMVKSFSLWQKNRKILKMHVTSKPLCYMFMSSKLYLYKYRWMSSQS